MKIKMLCSIITKDYVQYTHGVVYDVPKTLAKKLVDAKFAEKVKEKPKKTTKTKVEE